MCLTTFPFFISFANVNKSNVPCFIEKQQYTQVNKLKFSEKLRNVNWNEILSSDMCQEAYSMFIKKFKVYRNRLNSLLRKTEREYHNTLFHDNKNNLRKLWSLIRNVINKKNNNKSVNRFCIDNKITTDNHIIANSFNKFFVNIGSNLAKSIPNISKSPISYMSSNTDSIFVMPVLADEVRNIVLSLNNSSPGWDEISPQIIKENINI